MSTTVETLRLQLESNSAEYAKEIAKSENALEKLQVQLKLSPANFNAIDAAMDKEVENLEVYRKKLADAEAELIKLNATSGNAVNKLKGLGQAGLQTGRIIQDVAQGGIGGALNNIEGFTRAIGGGPGLAGAMTGLGVAIFLVKPYLDDFMEAMDPEKPYRFATSLSVLQDKIKELESKPTKLAIDMVELEQAKKKLEELTKAQAAFKAAGEGKTVFESEAGAQFKENFEQAGQAGVQARDAMFNAEVAKLQATDPQLNKAKGDQEKARATIERLKQFVSSGAATDDQVTMALADIEEQQAKIREARQHENQAIEGLKSQASGTIGNLIAGAEAGNNPKARAELAARLRGVGAANLAQMTELSNPQEMQRDAEQDAEEERRNAAAKAAREKAAKVEKRADESLALIEEFEAPALGDKALADQQKAAAAKKRADDKSDSNKSLLEQAKDAGKALDDREKSLRQTSLDEEAAEYAARLQAQGGDFDRNGRFRKLSREQQEEAVRREVGKRVAEADPSLNRLGQGTLTDRFTTGAYRQVDEQTEQARMMIAQQAQDANANLSSKQITNAALQETLAALTAIANKQRQEDAKTQQIGAGMAQVRRFVQQPGRPHGLNGGQQ